LSAAVPQSSIYGFKFSKRSTIAKSIFLVAAFLQVTLWESTCAADGKPQECGLASVYSTDSEETASGEDTQSKDLTAAHRSLPFGTMVQVDKKTGARQSCGLPIVALSQAEGLLIYQKLPPANSAFQV